jgi:hypothetical protein
MFAVSIDAEGVLDVNALWKASRLLVPVGGGGVSIVPNDALDENRMLRVTAGTVETTRVDVGGEREGKQRWWD